MKILKNYQQAFLHLPGGIAEAEAEAERESKLSVLLRDGVHNGASSSEVTALFVRASGEKTGFTYTQNLEEEPLDVINRAYQNSFYSEADGPEWMNAGADTREDSLNLDCMREKENAQFTNCMSENETSLFQDNTNKNESSLLCSADADACENLTIQELWAAAEQLDAYLAEREPHVAVRQISITDCVRGLGIVNTKGCDREYASHIFTLSLFLTDDRYPGAIFNKEYSRKQLTDLSPEIFASDLHLWQMLQTNETVNDFTSGSVPCVVSGTVMCNMLLTSWQMFTASHYIGRQTPFAGKKDQRIGSPLVSLSDRVSTEESGYQYPVDCEGSLGSDTILVENGVLKHLMNNLTSAEAMQEAPTGNAGRKALLSGNIHTDILVTPKNFRMDPGSDTLETLFEKMQNGVYLYDSLDVFHSIHIASGDYSIPCEGILIRDGKMAGKLPGLTINGKIQDLLKDITAVGNDPATCCMPILNSYLVSSPSVLVSKISVSR